MRSYDVCAILTAVMITLSAVTAFVKSARKDSGRPYRRNR